MKKKPPSNDVIIDTGQNKLTICEHIYTKDQHRCEEDLNRTHV